MQTPILPKEIKRDREIKKEERNIEKERKKETFEHFYNGIAMEKNTSFFLPFKSLLINIGETSLM